MRANNIQSLIKDEIVKRFEAVIKEEIRQYSLTVSRQDSEMLAIRSLLESILKDQNEWNVKNMQSKQDCIDAFKKEKKDLFEKNEDHRRYVNEKVNSFNKDVECLKQDSLLFVKNSDLVKSLLTLKSEMIDMEFRAELERKRLRELIDQEKQTILSKIDMETKTLNEHNDLMTRQYQEQEKKINVSSVDSKGILKELLVYKKSMLIIEKKIENIYTLIERNTKTTCGGCLLAKQE